MIDSWSAMGRGTMLRAAIVLQLLVHLISGSGQTAFALGVMMPLQSWARHPATARRNAKFPPVDAESAHSERDFRLRSMTHHATI